ncbi:uncharacterized protein B0P05DRAFT_589469 [Gilbertella persicaria]|uniref:uncharacterized protein n=1 Tax=Gilbertella persicaria TaxID=101096 RepID=UPI002220C481|nr:uncharacterized protein B0P05DRAFT_589469 [Gilbertella persicaria]KAI8068107.1 hypothetical protein B0P05DRAFT_589469 [Gilbertella persicaria]
MDKHNYEAESGDLKQIQREHQLSEKRKSATSSSSSLLERRQSNSLSALSSDEAITPMPTGAERMAALKNLGATFEEGQRSIAKVATPTETIVPSFVDSDHLEKILHEKKNKNLSDTCKETKAL